jgi:hypothetical protein
MASVDEQFSSQFRSWEQRGRGWKVWDTPVSPEPPFSHFRGHFLEQPEPMDDGRKPTALSSFIQRLSERLSTESAPATEEPTPEEEPEPESESEEREELVEILASLPMKVSAPPEAFGLLLRSLTYTKEPVTFEVLGSAERILTQFVTHPSDAPSLVRGLQAYFPEAAFTQTEQVLQDAWEASEDCESAIVEFGLAREFMFPLTSKGHDVLLGLTAALSGLNERELGLYQIIFKPVEYPWAESILRAVSDSLGKPRFINTPELLSQGREKVSKPLFAVVVRIATRSDTFSRAWEIMRDMAGALRGFANLQGNELIPLKNDDYPFEDHEGDVLKRQSRRSGMILNQDELIGFVHLPSPSIQSAKLVRETRKTKALPKPLQAVHGILLGHNHHCGKIYEVRQSAEQRVRHTHIIGTSGTGKSTLLCNMILQDIENGQGVGVLDPHGDLIDRILENLPPNRIEDVILVDPADEEYAVGFNILSAHSDLEKNLLASDLVSVFQRLSTSWGDQMNAVLGNAIRAFLESSQGGTLSDLRRFLIEPEFRNEFLKSVNDPDVVYYWKKGFSLLSGNKSVGPVLTRLETFLSPKPIRYMVSQKENRLDFADIMNGRKIFLAKLSQGQIGKENSYLLGSLFVTKFHQIAMSRQNMREADRRNFWLYLDEFFNFITPSMAEILTGARKYRVGLILAHQELRQLQRDPEVASAVLSNPHTRVCFRVGDQDAKTLENGFSFFEAKDLQNLGIGEAICRVERSDFDFNLAIPLPPETDRASAALVREQAITSSRTKYALPRSEIEAMLWKRAEEKTEVIRPLPSTKEKVDTQQSKDIEAPLPKQIFADPITPITEDTEAPTVIPPPIPEESLAETATGAPGQDKGIGGNQHNLIRERIELVARQLGYSTSRESPTGSGGKIDIVLEKPQRAIACEIAITTTIDHEVGNVVKCLKAGFRQVAVISPSTDRLNKIKNAVAASLSTDESSLVGYFLPDEFLVHLQTLASAETPAGSTSDQTERQAGKYLVTRKAPKLTPEERKQRETAAHQMLAEKLRKKP